MELSMARWGCGCDIGVHIFGRDVAGVVCEYLGRILSLNLGAMLGDPGRPRLFSRVILILSSRDAYIAL